MRVENWKAKGEYSESDWPPALAECVVVMVRREGERKELESKVEVECGEGVEDE